MLGFIVVYDKCILNDTVLGTMYGNGYELLAHSQSKVLQYNLARIKLAHIKLGPRAKTRPKTTQPNVKFKRRQLSPHFKRGKLWL